MHKEIYTDLKELLMNGAQFHECLKLWCNENGYRGMRRVHWYNQKRDYERACDLDEFILNQPYDFDALPFMVYPAKPKAEIKSYKEMLEYYKKTEKENIVKLRDLACKLREENDFTGYSYVYDIIQYTECEYNKLCITIRELTSYNWDVTTVYLKEKQIHDKMKEKM